VTGLNKKRAAWTVAFLGVTLTAIVMECIAGLWHPTGWTIPWTEYLARYVPWPIQLIAYVALATWLPFHFWRHDHMRRIAYDEGRQDGLEKGYTIGRRAAGYRPGGVIRAGGVVAPRPDDPNRGDVHY
jgi:hypothetical protein